MRLLGDTASSLPWGLWLPSSRAKWCLEEHPRALGAHRSILASSGDTLGLED